MAPRAATMSPSGRLALTYGADERVPVLTIWDYTKEFPLAPPQQLGEATFRLIQRSLSAADSTEVVRCPNVAGLDGLLLQVSSRAEIIHSFKYDAQIDAAPSAPRSGAIVSHCVATTPAPPEVHPPWEQAHTCGWTVRWFARRAIGCCVTRTRADDRRGPQRSALDEGEGGSIARRLSAQHIVASANAVCGAAAGSIADSATGCIRGRCRPSNGCQGPSWTGVAWRPAGRTHEPSS
jgi:hypothetical protein